MKITTKGILVLFTLALAGCASPAAEMTPQQVSTLSNSQLCDLHNGYAWETNTELEIGRRNLNCDPLFNECLNRGADPNTAEMTLCIDQIRQTQALQQQVYEQQRELEREREKNKEHEKDRRH